MSEHELVRVSRAIAVPDPVRIERHARLPELGPRVLFFSGGTALRPLCRVLKTYTHNSVHLITPFDSGGSSAALRRAFSMPAVGDLRNRLLALADESVQGNPATYRLFSHRLGAEGSPAALSETLAAMTTGQHPLVRAISPPLRRIVRTHLRTFAQRMPGGFDLRNASVGNLLLTGGCLANDGDINSVVFLFSRLIKARGLVRPIVDDDLTLYASTRRGLTIAGQHAITAREDADDPIVELWLGRSQDDAAAVHCEVEPYVTEQIRRADLICFPMGSFFTSVMANLLPAGVGRAICEAPCPKIFVPNTGLDPEQRGVSVAAAVDHLVRAVRRDAGAEVPAERILNFVLLDVARGRYHDPSTVAEIEARGVAVLDRPVAGEGERLDPTAVTQILLSLA
ncbi:MAG: GAK system CofD-like protein [Nannocystaceae bacterium]|nr:GAK system CofD-like protein [bacterium]